MSGSVARKGAPAAAALCILALAPAGALAAPKARTIYLYDVKVGITGTGTLDGTYDAPASSARPRDVIEEHFKASYGVDTKIRDLVVVPRAMRGYPRTAEGNREAVLNGTWTTRGVMWTDPDAGLTAPFTCSGRVETTAPTPTTIVRYTRKGSRLAFEVEVISDSLVSPGACDVNGRRGGLEHTNAFAYQSEFTLPASRFGARTITKTISGPMQKLDWRQYQCAGCTFTLAWQGTVRFTLRRTMRLGA